MCGGGEGEGGGRERERERGGESMRGYNGYAHFLFPVFSSQIPSPDT